MTKEQESRVVAGPENAPPFEDTPVLKAKRQAFDAPTQANLDALIAAVQLEALLATPPAGPLFYDYTNALPHDFQPHPNGGRSCTRCHTDEDHAEAKWNGGRCSKTAELKADGVTSSASPADHEQCICAAIRLPNGEVWRGHRHDSAIITAGKAPDVKRDDIYEAEQGFITSRNRFVGREEGARLQRAAGIVSALTLQPVGDTLFSEDLYLRDWRSQ